uniref:ISXO2-like transposase domain-containing protein n=1 Tax=Octopus bimaculoides TaxID=37653 RepID=A0A0L8H004_OCTBM
MTGLSNSTVVQWYQYMRDITSNSLLRNPYQIGGLGYIIEIDESMMCKRKYNRGRIPQERWVFGGWNREDKKGFLVFVPDRSSETLLPLIKKFIKPSTTVYSDCLSAYNGITEIDVTPKFSHFKVNHSENFVDPTTGVHTNSVECYWKNARLRFKTMMGVHTDIVESYLDEFLWREQYGKTRNECFKNVVKHLSEWFTFQQFS